MVNNRMTDGVGKKIVDALKKQTDVDIIQTQTQTQEPEKTEEPILLNDTMPAFEFIQETPQQVHTFENLASETPKQQPFTMNFNQTAEAPSPIHTATPEAFINEFDDIDHSAVHLCAYLNDTAVGCLRFFPERNDASVWHLGRVAVLPHYRHQKIATAFLTQAKQTIRQKGAQRIRLDAQKAVCSLYAQAGYQICGTPFYDEHMEHIIIAVLVIQLDLIFWGLCCFTVLGILKLYSRQSWHACIQQLNKKKTALLLLSAELLHFPLSFVLLFLYQSIFRSIEFCFVISLLCLLFVSIRFFTVLHYLDEIKTEL